MSDFVNNSSDRIKINSGLAFVNHRKITDCISVVLALHISDIHSFAI
ncbi:hypothetical protein [Anabaena azotica]|uniref:Transposase n=1 Tax=Anabaena azotica FACHB-119 TaxID=947527 RepID=A0ABR8CX05_9NOST|nr:hypothetical protein [Anabaena azotica]MBD2499257.1 hypothetical protein [Anabaena azotica FACHB-119]